ncbi:MAG: hypothetical protein HYY06_33465 [Deltaproteobacteria bacterium]|nr:hypothetical protein [Deltaproteobacteria bacterium]
MGEEKRDDALVEVLRALERWDGNPEAAAGLSAQVRVLPEPRLKGRTPDEQAVFLARSYGVSGNSETAGRRCRGRWG